MPLEATMMVIDNSEYMRNGDYQPNRFDAQADAVNVVFQTKIDSNPENTVGIMSMAGKGCVLSAESPVICAHPARTVPKCSSHTPKTLVKF